MGHGAGVERKEERGKVEELLPNMVSVGPVEVGGIIWVALFSLFFVLGFIYGYPLTEGWTCKST